MMLGTEEGRAAPVQLLDPSGQLCETSSAELDWSPDVTAQSCRNHYRQMRRARRFDQEAFALQRHGEIGLWAPALGQEAAQIGSISALRASDFVFPTYRDHAAALYRGIPPAQMLAQWHGTAGTGWDPRERSFFAYGLVLAAHLPHATGYAMGVQRDGTDEVVMAYIGDGATSQGDANEAFNWAATLNAPILFFCQNNQWAISTPVRGQMCSPIHHRAAGFGLGAYVVDGNDVLAVNAVTRLAVEQIRADQGPVLIEALTYRMGAHTSSDDATRYRDGAELEQWSRRDPIARLRLFMERSGWTDLQYEAQIESECDDLGAEVRAACGQFPAMDLSERFTTVLAQQTPLLARERHQYETSAGERP